MTLKRRLAVIGVFLLAVVSVKNCVFPILRFRLKLLIEV